MKRQFVLGGICFLVGYCVWLGGLLVPYFWRDILQDTPTIRWWTYLTGIMGSVLMGLGFVILAFACVAIINTYIDAHKKD